MAFLTYVLLGSFALGLQRKLVLWRKSYPLFSCFFSSCFLFDFTYFTFDSWIRFSPNVVSSRFTRALIGWFVETILVRFILYTVGTAEVPILDLVAYSGYFFVGISTSLFSWLCWHHSYYVVTIITRSCVLSLSPATIFPTH